MKLQELSIRFCIYAVIVLLNAILLFDENVSQDFANYTRFWRAGNWTWQPVEVVFQNLGVILGQFDFRYFFVILNGVALAIICKRYSIFLLLWILTSPFTVLGFGNTLLSFSAGLVWLAIFLGQGLRAAVLATMVHKGGVFLFLFDRPVLMILIGLVVYFWPEHVPFMGNLHMFEEPWYQVGIKYTLSISPLLAIAFLGGGKDWIRQCRDIGWVAVFVAIIFLVSTKLADRIVYMCFFWGLLRAQMLLSSTTRKIAWWPLYGFIPLNIFLTYMSGARMHLPFGLAG